MRILVLLAVVGCGISNDAPTTFDPQAVVSGVYHLTVTAQDDSCTPHLEFSSGDVGAFADPTGLRTFTRQTTAFGTNEEQYALPADTDFTDHVPRDGNTISPCGPASAGNTITTEYTLVAADARSFEVDLDRTYIIGQACTGAPQASCHASVTLRYELADGCPTNCITSDTSNQPTCSCH